MGMGLDIAGLNIVGVDIVGLDIAELGNVGQQSNRRADLRLGNDALASETLTSCEPLRALEVAPHCRKSAALSRVLLSSVLLCLGLLAPSVLHAQFTLTGQVVSDQGPAIAGVNIDVFFAGTATEVALSGDSTDVTGAFTTLGAAAPAGFYDIVFEPPVGANSLPLTLTNILLPTNQALGVVTLQSAFFMTGRITNEAGTGLAEVDLQVFDSNGTLVATTGDVTDALGFYSLLLPADIYSVEFRETPLTPGGPYIPRRFEEIPLLTSDLNLPDLDLKVGVTLSGTVTNGSGGALVGADLDVFDAVTGEEIVLSGDTTGVGGTVSVLVPVGDFLLEVDPPTGQQLVPQLINLTTVPAPGVNSFSAQLPPGFAVSGTTVNNVGGAVPNVDLDFLVSATGVEIATADDNANGAGVFSVLVAQNTYDIEFRPSFATGLAPRVIINQVVGAGGLAMGAVTLNPGNAITGNVNNSGTPLFGVSITATDTLGNRVVVFGGDTNLLGNYAIREEPGIYNLTFTPPVGSGLQSQTVTVDVSLGDVIQDIDLGAAPTPPPPVVALGCVDVGDSSQLSWSNGAVDYDNLEVFRGGVSIAVLAGTVESYADMLLPPGTYDYDVFAVRAGLTSTGMSCSVTIPPAATLLIRGDANGDGNVSLGDALTVLNGMFAGGTIPCRDAADVDDSGSLLLTDPLRILNYLFAGGVPPAAPFPDCGVDSSADSFDCVTSNGCP